MVPIFVYLLSASGQLWATADPNKVPTAGVSACIKVDSLVGLRQLGAVTANGSGNTTWTLTPAAGIVAGTSTNATDVI